MAGKTIKRAGKLFLAALGVAFLGFLALAREEIYFVYLNLVETTQLEVDENILFITGDINSQTPEQVKAVFEKNGGIDTIIFGDVPGSIDDEANLELANWLIKKDLTTVLTRDSHVASGGTDLFLVGDTRHMESGALIGVHSWRDVNSSATDYGRDSPLHRPYIEYYEKAGFSPQQAEEFYFFTINAAPPEGIYYMTDEEITQFGIAEIIQPLDEEETPSAEEAK